jgi:hypothetical protein
MTTSASRLITYAETAILQLHTGIVGLQNALGHFLMPGWEKETRNARAEWINFAHQQIVSIQTTLSSTELSQAVVPFVHAIGEWRLTARAILPKLPKLAEDIERIADPEWDWRPDDTAIHRLDAMQQVLIKRRDKLLALARDYARLRGADTTRDTKKKSHTPKSQTLRVLGQFEDEWKLKGRGATIAEYSRIFATEHKLSISPETLVRHYNCYKKHLS